LYSDAGTNTCQGRPGSLGYETIDADTYAYWGVDYLKYDNCNSGPESPMQRYPVMSDALLATGQPIFFSMCEWGVDNPATWAAPVGNSWRTTGDIQDNWGSMLSNLDSSSQWAKYAGPGGWNDPDMLEVGNGGMTTTEYISHFSLWALMKAPLIIGCNLATMDNDTLMILTNSEVIAVNQDPLGIQGNLVNTNGTSQVWAGPLVGGVEAVILFNLGNDNATVTAYFVDWGWADTTEVSVRDIWAHNNIGTATGSFSASVESHGVVFVILTPTNTFASEDFINTVV